MTRASHAQQRAFQSRTACRHKGWGGSLVEREHRWDTGAVMRLWESSVLVCTGRNEPVLAEMKPRL